MRPMSGSALEAIKVSNIKHEINGFTNNKMSNLALLYEVQRCWCWCNNFVCCRVRLHA